jgi:hypothetical protein
MTHSNLNFNDMPTELFLPIFEYLPLTSVMALSSTCRNIWEISRHPAIWRSIAHMKRIDSNKYKQTPYAAVKEHFQVRKAWTRPTSTVIHETHKQGVSCLGIHCTGFISGGWDGKLYGSNWEREFSSKVICLDSNENCILIGCSNNTEAILLQSWNILERRIQVGAPVKCCSLKGLL